ncbi:hypothetical protein L1987_15900 [Smallanthus sonchifolius]|uniref:Uncharacterized protein n=1 Tax=Smallanthus sonchifolius TaxID=185202 RepID=A0ACB9J7D0_9ASTR|nr:hypothetical protein L1987_15900 [Smallanthus sonchifolius]
MYTMARTPYIRSPSFSQKGIRSDYGHGAASTSSQSALGHEGKMALKRRSSVLDDVIGSGGPLRRIRHKANVLSQRDKKELGCTVFQQDGSSLNVVLPNETEPKVLGYASVPAKSTQTANKILQHLEKPSPKEKIERQSVSSHAGMREKSSNKLTSDMLHGQALRSLEKVDLPKFLPSPRDTQKPEAQHHARLHEQTSQSKDKTEDNGSRKFPVPCKMLTSVSGDSTDSLKDKAPGAGFTDLPSKVQEEPPQKKRAFQMSASGDAVEIDDDIHDNGHMSFPLVKYNKPATSVADIIRTPAVPEVSKTHTSVENNIPVLPEVAKVPAQAEVKEAEKATSFPNTD